MARKVRTITTDDLDGSPGAEPVRFSLDGQHYEIDLGPFNRRRLHEEVQLFTSAGRRVGFSKAGRKPASRPDLADIRAWARTEGLHVPERGRICASVVERYDAAHPPGSAAP